MFTQTKSFTTRRLMESMWVLAIKSLLVPIQSKSTLGIERSCFHGLENSKPNYKVKNTLVMEISISNIHCWRVDSSHLRTVKSVAERDLGSDDLFLDQKSGILGEDCALSVHWILFCSSLIRLVIRER